jgi:DEAD/DEAH box helicase domain-containing protein
MSPQSVPVAWTPDLSITRYHTNPKFLPFPAKHIALRGAQEEKYTVVDVTKRLGGSANIIEEVEISRALFELYEGGVVSFQLPSDCVPLISFSLDIFAVYPSRADLHCMTTY